MANTKKNSPWFEKYLRREIRRIWAWSPARKAAKKRASVGYDRYKCEECNKQPLVPKEKEVDHIVPCEYIGPWDEGGKWNGLIERTLDVPTEGLKVLCKPCHQKKSKEENALRRKLRMKK